MLEAFECSGGVAAEPVGDEGPGGVVQFDPAGSVVVSGQDSDGVEEVGSDKVSHGSFDSGKDRRERELRLFDF